MATTINSSVPAITAHPPLPDTLQATQGPGVSDSDCPICQQPFEESSPTVEHPDCGRRFDDECIRAWLTSSTTRTCPVCRMQLMEAEEEVEYDVSDEEEEDEYNISDEEEEIDENQRFLTAYNLPNFITMDRLRLVNPHPLSVYTLRKRQSLPAPTEWHVASNERQIRDIVQPLLPHIPANDLLELVTTEVELTRNILRVQPWHDQMQLRHSQDLIEEIERYQFNNSSIQCLWTSTRVFSVYGWLCLRMGGLPPAHHVAIWIPVPESITPLTNQEELMRCLPQDLYESLVIGGLPWDLIQIPLPTELVVDRFSWFDREEQWTTGSRHLARLAEEMKVTHWALILVVEEGWNPKVYALPWPEAEVEEGYQVLTYPGWGPRRRNVQSIGGWEGDLADRCLAAFLEERREGLGAQRIMTSEPE